MISMTGYGKAAISSDDYNIEIEIKSVNSKYLDIKFYMSKDMNFLEPLLRSYITKKYKRGFLEVRLKYSDHSSPLVSLNVQKLEALCTVFKTIAKITNNDKLPIEYMLREYDIVEYQSRLFESNSFTNDVIITLNKAVAEHQKAAKKEGLSIRKFITSTINKLSISINTIESTIEDYRNELYIKMRKRIEDIIPQSTSLNLEQRLMQELAIYLDRYDIQEEICRLKEHIDTLKSQLNNRAQNDMGKTLNFIFQEMQREANTLGSKYSNSMSFTHILVIKEEIEKCREIIQNVM